MTKVFQIGTFRGGGLVKDVPGTRRLSRMKATRLCTSYKKGGDVVSRMSSSANTGCLMHFLKNLLDNAAAPDNYERVDVFASVHRTRVLYAPRGKGSESFFSTVRTGSDFQLYDFRFV